MKRTGRDLTRGLFLRIDNVQTYVKHGDQRIGRENHMNIGIAGTAWETFDYNPMATSVLEKQRCIDRNLRAKVTVQQLASLVDLDHMRTIGILQWLQVLVQYIPQLAEFRTDVAELYRTEGSKSRQPLRKTAGHPLSTVAKNENATTELRDALVDFLEQIGQSDEDHQDRLQFIGGDGLTYERLLFMKRLQRHQSNAFRRLDMVQPFLETWHTQWMFLSSVFEAHYDTALSQDPSTLGHNMAKINQKPVTNVKKVDYYPAAYSAYLILDCRMLDCWR